MKIWSLRIFLIKLGIGENRCYNLKNSDISKYLKMVYEQMMLKS